MARKMMPWPSFTTFKRSRNYPLHCCFWPYNGHPHFHFHYSMFRKKFVVSTELNVHFYFSGPLRYHRRIRSETIEWVGVRIYVRVTSLNFILADSLRRGTFLAFIIFFDQASSIRVGIRAFFPPLSLSPHKLIFIASFGWTQKTATKNPNWIRNPSSKSVLGSVSRFQKKKKTRAITWRHTG